MEEPFDFTKFHYTSENFPDFNNLFADNTLIGTTGGIKFEANLLQKGAIVKGFKAWMTDDILNGIEVQMSNDSKHEFGCTEIKKGTIQKEIILNQWETIASLTIEKERMSTWSLKRGCITCLEITTNEGRTWKISSESKEKRKKGETEKYLYPVGSGICCGIFGFADNHTIYRIGFAMLNTVKEATFSNMKYLKEKNNYQVIPEIIKTLECVNKTDEKQQEKYKIVTIETTSKTWNSSYTLGRAVGATIRIGYPKVATVGGNVSSSKNVTEGNQTTLTNTATHEYEWTLSVPPKTTLIATGRINNVQLETEFEADMNVILQNGTEVSYTEKGTFTEMSRKDVWIEIEQKSLEQEQ